MDFRSVVWAVVVGNFIWSVIDAILSMRAKWLRQEGKG